MRIIGVEQQIMTKGTISINSLNTLSSCICNRYFIHCLLFRKNKVPLYILLKDNEMSMPTLYIMHNSENFKMYSFTFFYFSREKLSQNLKNVFPLHSVNVS